MTNKIEMKKAETFTFSKKENKYHEDDIINEFMEYVRYAPLDIDAIYNIPRILQRYEGSKRNWNFEIIIGIWFIFWIMVGLQF